jgi:hypothetical protein
MENFWNQCGNIPLSLLQQDIQGFSKPCELWYRLSYLQDKLPDAIKEFALSVNEQTKGVSDALKMRLVLVSRLHY